MADWVYAVGEENYDQGFSMFDRKKKAPYDGTGVTSATIKIITSDLSPAEGPNALTIDNLNPLRLLYTITTANMPQTPQTSYYVIIALLAGTEVRKTFEFDLEVRRG